MNLAEGGQSVTDMKNSALGKQKHIFIIGAKCIGQYGGYETFLDKLTEQHQDNKNIQYYIVTKANGDGHMDESKLNGVTFVNKHTFIYHNARVVKIHVLQMGPAQAIVYDIKALKYCISYAKMHRIENPIFYILACRIGPFFGSLVRRVHKLGGVVYVNPDGHEWKRAKWSAFIRKYWKKSEKLMVKAADLLICDSVNIEKYIKNEYRQYKPKTIFIAYGSDIRPSSLSDDDPRFTGWLKEKELEPFQYYMCCGRFVPENSFEIMIREFMKSHSKKNFAIITTNNDKFLEKLNQKLHFEGDPRIKFVGTVYDSELLKKIRENAYANVHGHTVGGTNPSLLEALGSTDINLLIDVGFNREVAEDAALYWKRTEGNLAALIEKTDEMIESKRKAMGAKAKERIKIAYSWKIIGDKYEKLWMR